MKNSLIRAISATLLLSGAAILPAHAEEIRVPIAQQGKAAVELPKRGTSKQAVEARFGAPMERVAAVGQPPISSWEYADFVVYFEYNHVIHSVVKHRKTAE